MILDINECNESEVPLCSGVYSTCVNNNGGFECLHPSQHLPIINRTQGMLLLFIVVINKNVKYLVIFIII